MAKEGSLETKKTLAGSAKVFLGQGGNLSYL